MQLRRALPEDATALADVEVATWRTAYRGLLPSAFLDRLSSEEKTESWRQNLLKHGTAGRTRVIVALKDDRIVGLVRVGLEENEGEDGLVYLLYVLPEHWHSGIGTALLRAGMDELRDLGAPEAILWVLRDNYRARHFYERLGWRQDGQITGQEYAGVELTALCYRRALDMSASSSLSFR